MQETHGRERLLGLYIGILIACLGGSVIVFYAQRPILGIIVYISVSLIIYLTTIGAELRIRKENRRTLVGVQHFILAYGAIGAITIMGLTAVLSVFQMLVG